MGGGHEPFQVPDWRRFTESLNCKAAKDHQKRLGIHGLRDPWLRNYAFKYREEGKKFRFYAPTITIFKKCLPWAAGFAVAMVIIDKLLIIPFVTPDAGKYSTHHTHGEKKIVPIHQYRIAYRGTHENPTGGSS